MSCDRGHTATRLRRGIEKATGAPLPPKAFCDTTGNPNDPAIIPPQEAALYAESMFTKMGVNPGNDPETAALVDDIREGRLPITRKHKRVMFLAPEMAAATRPKIGDPSASCDCKDCEYVGTDCCGNPTPDCETTRGPDGDDGTLNVCMEGYGCAPTAEERYAQIAAAEDAYWNSAEGQAYLDRAARDDHDNYEESKPDAAPAPPVKTYEERKKEETALDNPYIKEAMADTGLSRAVIKRVLRDEKTRLSLANRRAVQNGDPDLSPEGIADAARASLMDAARKEAETAQAKADKQAAFDNGRKELAEFTTANRTNLTRETDYSSNLRAGDILGHEGGVILGVQKATGGKTNVTYRRRDGAVIKAAWGSYTKIGVLRPTDPETRRAAIDTLYQSPAETP